MFSPFLSEQVRAAHDGPTWHGNALAESLVGIDAERAAARVIPEAHSVWEIVLHLTAWTREVTRRLEGDAHAALATAVARLPAERWSEPVGGERDAPLGTGVSHAAMVAGLLQHDAYHGGQIGLLRKALRV